LSAAVEYADFKIVKLLFDNGGSIEHGQLLHHAAYRTLDDRTQVLEYLVEKGLSVNNVRYQNRPDCYDMQKNWSLGTPLHYAANRGKLDAVK
jgi:ankyrin repeat protein